MVVAVVAIAGGCGDGVISQDQILADIPGAILADHPDLIEGIACEPEVGLDPATPSQCSATLADEPISFTVTAAGGNDSVVVVLEESVIDTAPLIADARRSLRADLGAKLTVDCDVAAVIVAVKGAQFACTATDEAEHSFSIRLLDEIGNYRINLG
ncbi:MAG: hypothetical protein IH940_00255 [Acidobacteria bacterium]|nr:hypothetical protein [Acidobacteriota bacterium]